MTSGLVGRRQVLRGIMAGAVGSVLIARPARATVDIVPRDEWGGDLPPTGALQVEEDVRFLLVHHTAGSNDYAQDDVPSLLRGIYRFHTGEKGWPDVAYNFFVDRYGGVWEGRTGSLTQAIRTDATGGSQGWAVLCCFLGDHSSQAPTAEATASMTSLLASLADRHDIDTSPGALVTFTSRGSNRWPEGDLVEAATISAHRDMSLTECPGDVGYALVRERLPTEVTAMRGGSRAPAADASPAEVTEPPTLPPVDAVGSDPEELVTLSPSAPPSALSPAPPAPPPPAPPAPPPTSIPAAVVPTVTPPATSSAPLVLASPVPSPGALPIARVNPVAVIAPRALLGLGLLGGVAGVVAARMREPAPRRREGPRAPRP